MKIKAIKTKIFKENEDLLSFILRYIKKLSENSVVVVTSKIVALSEGRTAPFISQEQKISLIKKESDFAMPTKYVWLTIKDGMVMASAGIDESNGNGKIILLPKDSFKTAKMLRRKLMLHFKLKNLGVLITDSRLMPLRAGIVGVALGYAGFKGLRNYVGKGDIFGRKMLFSKTNVADSLATAAVLCTGEGNEQQPLCLIENPPVVFCDRIKKNEIIIDPKEDIYAPLFKRLKINQRYAKNKKKKNEKASIFN